MLAHARAVSAGLRQLGLTLGDQAETILREVQAGHRRLRAELRAVTGRSGDSGAERDRPRSSGLFSESRERSERSSSSGVFDELEVPSWAEPKDGRR
jgi:hypothetical protein